MQVNIYNEKKKKNFRYVQPLIVKILRISDRNIYNKCDVHQNTAL